MRFKPRKRKAACSVILLLAVLAPHPRSARAAQGDCGIPVGSGAAPTASDALAILRAAVGLTGQCPPCTCDVTGDGLVKATDSLEVLQSAVGQPVVLACPPCTTSTTIPISDLVSTTTTSISTTTTTYGGGAQCACEITFGVTNTETLGALQYDTSYAGVGGGFDGTAGSVDCTRLAGDFAAFNDIEAGTQLSSALISAAGFTGPIDVARCRYTRPGLVEPVAGDFPITIIDQSRPDFSPANATVEVTYVACVCSGGTSCVFDADCNDGNPCTRDVCSPGAEPRFCTSVAEPGGLACGDPSDTECDNPDSCDGVGSCVGNHEPAFTLCRESNGPCDVIELCDGIGNCPADASAPDGAPCDDAAFCTTGDTCLTGMCIGGPDPCPGADGDADCTESCDEAADSCSAPDPGSPCTGSTAGRMTGGGRFYFDSGSNEGLTHALRLTCDTALGPNRLRLVWRKDGERFQFRLAGMNRVSCSDNPAIGPAPPAAGFDTHSGEGHGQLRRGHDRQPNATVSWRFTDAGEPNAQDDVSELIVRDTNGSVVLQVAAKLFVGNHQAHAR